MSPIRNAASAEPHASDTDELLRVIASMIRELRPESPVRNVRLDDDLDRDLGLDSLSRVELTLRIEQAFGVGLPEKLVTSARTPRDLAGALAQAGARSSRKQPQLAVVPAPAEEALGAPDQAQTLTEAFQWHLARHPGREHITFLLGEDETAEVMTYGDVWTEATEAGQGLQAHGIARGDRVAIMLPTGRTFFQTFLGALLIGAVPVPMYPPARWSQIEEHVRGRAAILANCGASVLVTVREAQMLGRIVRAELPSLRHVIVAESLREGRSPVAPQSAGARDTALLQYTSGSTGDPKGVILSHADVLANIRIMGRAISAQSRDRFISWLPLYHDMGLIGAWLATMYFSIPLVLMPPTAFLARPVRWLWAVHRYRGTLSAGPNFAYEILASKVRDDDLTGLDLSSWRVAFNGAEPVRAATLERFTKRFAPYGFNPRALTPVYGLAECAVGLTFPPLDRGPLVERVDRQALARNGQAVPTQAAGDALEIVSCGRPLPGYQLRVVNDSGRELPDRTDGHVQFRGPSATQGYFHNTEATGDLFQGDWLQTGDVGYTAGGELFVTSRRKDLIKRGGHNIHPYDLEAVIGDLPGVRKGCIAVFGSADRATSSERVIVVAETAATDPAVRATLQQQIMDLAVIHLNGPPDEVLLVRPHTVLKTSSGKIRRDACRQLFERGLLQEQRRAVWVQMARLVVAAGAARVRRALRECRRVSYGAYLWALLAFILAIGFPFLVGPMGMPRRMRMARFGARLLIRLSRMPVSVEGTQHLVGTSPAVLVINHASYLDVFLLNGTLPINVHFVAKNDFYRVPVLGRVLQGLGTYFVERTDATGGIESTRALSAAAKRGEVLGIFPEGTFTRAAGLAPFRLGAFVVSVESGVPVIPVVVRGMRSVLRDGQWLPNRGRVEVLIQPPIRPVGSDWSAAIRLRDAARAVILSKCGEPDLAEPTAMPSSEAPARAVPGS